MDIEARIKALCVVGNVLGIEEMLKLVQDTEIRNIYNYTKLAFVNTHGLDQEREGLVWARRQNASMFGKKSFEALNQYCISKIIMK